MEKGFSIEGSTVVNILNRALRAFQQESGGTQTCTDFSLIFILAGLCMGWETSAFCLSSPPLIGSYCLPAGQRMSSKDYKIHRTFPFL